MSEIHRTLIRRPLVRTPMSGLIEP